MLKVVGYFGKFSGARPCRRPAAALRLTLRAQPRSGKMTHYQMESPQIEANSFAEGKDYRWLVAMSLVRVRNNNAPSEIAGVAMQVSPRSFVAATENCPDAGTTSTFPVSPEK